MAEILYSAGRGGTGAGVETGDETTGRAEPWIGGTTGDGRPRIGTGGIGAGTAAAGAGTESGSTEYGIGLGDGKVFLGEIGGSKSPGRWQEGGESGMKGKGVGRRGVLVNTLGVGLCDEKRVGEERSRGEKGIGIEVLGSTGGGGEMDGISGGCELVSQNGDGGTGGTGSGRERGECKG